MLFKNCYFLPGKEVLEIKKIKIVSDKDFHLINKFLFERKNKLDDFFTKICQLIDKLILKKWK